MVNGDFVRRDSADVTEHLDQSGAGKLDQGKAASLIADRDPLYASNGARPDAAHYSASVERRSAYRWAWEVVHWPETYVGYNGRVYPGIDWREGGTALTETVARKAVERAIRERKQLLAWESEAHKWDVAG